MVRGYINVNIYHKGGNNNNEQKMHLKILLIATSIVFWVSIEKTTAYSTYIQLIPNGGNVPGVAAIGHVNPNGGGARNAFGLAFAAGGYQWSAVCNADSDGDGFTNSQELGANCSGTITRVTGLSNPGDSNSLPTLTTPAPATPTPATPTPATPTPATPTPPVW